MHEGTRKVYSLLRQHGHDLNRFVVGTGKTYYTEGTKSRFKFDATKRQEILDKTAEFAIKYYSAHGFYLVWKVKGQTKHGTINRGSFSVAAADVMNVYSQSLNVHKGVEFVWSGTEKVWVLSYQQLEGFIANL